MFGPLIGGVVPALVLMAYCLWVSLKGIWKDACNGYGLMGVEFGCTLFEVLLGGSFHTVNPVTCLYDVQIYLHYSFFAPEKFDEDSVISLEAFAPPALTTKCKAVFGYLLTDGAATTYLFPFLLMFFPHFAEFLNVKSMVCHESTIFGSYHGANHYGGNVLNIYPSACVLIVILIAVLYGSFEHQGSPCHRGPFINQNPCNADCEKCNNR